MVSWESWTTFSHTPTGIYGMVDEDFGEHLYRALR